MQNYSRDAGVDGVSVEPLVDLLLLVVGDADPPVLVPQGALAGNTRHVFLERIEVDGSNEFDTRNKIEGRAKKFLPSLVRKVQS